MVQEDKYCIDILTQISAAQKALDSVALELLTSHVKHCMNNGDIENKADELMDALRRFVKAN